MRRTKILATLGPASHTDRGIRRLIRSGANGFRINCSHGTSDEHRSAIRSVREEARRASREIFVVADLQGPKIRLGDLSPSPLALRPGQRWTLDDRKEPGGPERAPARVPNLRGSARPGDPILLGDGDVELRVESVGAEGVRTRVVTGGHVSSHAGIFLPRAKLRTQLLGPKDRDDLRAALEEKVDFVALSFVRVGEDLLAARRLAARWADGEGPGWIAKIERAEALENLDGILEASDAIMVARGDLGIEVPLERLALEQKRLVARARGTARPAIVATQMLLSMVHAARPTRAEATDVANAVLDGADCVMLSEESAVGEHPAEAVAWLDRICGATEAAGMPTAPAVPSPGAPDRTAEGAVARAALQLAEELEAAAILTPTRSGRTARWIASGRPAVPIVALSSHPEVRRRLGLVWGVEARNVPDHLSLLQLREHVATNYRGLTGKAHGGPLVVTAGYPVEGRPTNLVTVVDGP